MYTYEKQYSACDLVQINIQRHVFISILALANGGNVSITMTSSWRNGDSLNVKNTVLQLAIEDTRCGKSTSREGIHWP